MFLQPQDLGVEPQSLGLVFYLCMFAVMVIVFAIAIKKAGNLDD
jgi:hypothetical protein